MPLFFERYVGLARTYFFFFSSDSLLQLLGFSVFDAKNGSNGGIVRNDDDCDCLPSCLELTYDAQVTEVMKDFSEMSKVDPSIISKRLVDRSDGVTSIDRYLVAKFYRA